MNPYRSPLHMINDGDTIETIDILQLVVRSVKVLDLLTSVEEKISKKDIENHDIQENDFSSVQNQELLGHRVQL
jgi:arylformamidase